MLQDPITSVQCECNCTCAVEQSECAPSSWKWELVKGLFFTVAGAAWQSLFSGVRWFLSWLSRLRAGNERSAPHNELSQSALSVEDRAKEQLQDAQNSRADVAGGRDPRVHLL